MRLQSANAYSFLHPREVAISTNAHHVVIIGGGFAGLRVALHLDNPAVRVTLIDRRNFHLFQPLLYQVATGTLSPANIATPIRGLFRRQKNVQVLLAEAVDFDAAGRRVILSDGFLAYDTLIVAAGVRNHYFGHPEWEALAPALKSVEDATEIRRRILLAFEAAERESAADKRRAWLTFVVVGGGPTGVELAGQIRELALHTLSREFRTYWPGDAEVLLLEAGERILASFPADLSAKAAAALGRLGVEVRVQHTVTAIAPDAVVVGYDGQTERIATRTVLWAAGVRASPLGEKLASATGATLDRASRVVVQPDLSVPGHPEIFVLGDLANFSHQTGAPLPGVAPVAMQQGRYVAQLLLGRLRGQTLPSFRYHDKGSLATIGRNAAVADLGRIRYAGYFAWLTWLFVHILFLVQFQNRLLVLIQWAWNYFSRNRSARLITGQQGSGVGDQESGVRS